MKKSFKKIMKILVVVFFVLAGAGALVVGRYYTDNKKPNFTKQYVLYVTPEMTADQVIDSLVANAGVIKTKSLERTFAKMDVTRNIKPGKYVVEASHPSIYVARMLVYNWQTPQMMAVSGTIRNKGVLAKKIGMQMMVDSAEVAAALADEAFLAKYGFDHADWYGMILPDTYEMYWTATVDEIFDRLKAEYDAFWNEERLANAKAQGLTPKEVSTMASIVSGETLKEFEYPIIAGVYLNRYKRGIKLQADPTICFCYDYTLNRVLKKHLTIDSPYNTYKYVGLPPAPINVPSKACLEAVLNPQKHDYIFFCASAAFDGTHKFAVSYNEHMKNAREFQRALTARNRAKAGK